MQWWNDFMTWFNSDEGWRVISGAVIPFVAIIVAGIIGGLIGRNSTRRLLSWQDRELQSAAVAAIIGVGDKASMWSTLPAGEKDHLDAQMSAADIRLRLLPITGSSAAADWASHELALMQRNSANFSFQAEQSFIDYRDRLLEWQRRPGRARKLFAADLERFRFESTDAETELVDQQRKWAADQLAEATREAPSDSATAPAALGAGVVATDAVVVEAPVPSAIDAPQQAETVEPVAAEPVVVEPTAEPEPEPVIAYDAPASGPEPVHDEPLHEPVVAQEPEEPNYAATAVYPVETPARVEPVELAEATDEVPAGHSSVEPAVAAPAYAEPTSDEPSYDEPAYEEPEPAPAEPATEAEFTQAYAEPVYTPPAYSEPSAAETPQAESESSAAEDSAQDEPVVEDAPPTESTLTKAPYVYEPFVAQPFGSEPAAATPEPEGEPQADPEPAQAEEEKPVDAPPALIMPGEPTPTNSLPVAPPATFGRRVTRPAGSGAVSAPVDPNETQPYTGPYPGRDDLS